jgi:hypothetical protein
MHIHRMLPHWVRHVRMRKPCDNAKWRQTMLRLPIIVHVTTTHVDDWKSPQRELCENAWTENAYTSHASALVSVVSEYGNHALAPKGAKPCWGSRRLFTSQLRMSMIEQACNVNYVKPHAQKMRIRHMLLHWCPSCPNTEIMRQRQVAPKHAMTPEDCSTNLVDGPTSGFT